MKEVHSMPLWVTVLLIVLGVLVVALGLLYYFGNKMMKRNEAAQEQLEAAKQQTSLLVIDKKRMKLKESNLPQAVIDQTPRYLRNSKVPLVKAKVGPRIMTFMCDEKIFDLIPVKKEVKAVISGIYIMDVKGVRGSLETKPEKVSFFKKMKNKITRN